MATSLIPLKNSTVWKDADMVPTSGDPITAEWITSVMGNLIMASFGLEKTAVAWGTKTSHYNNITADNTVSIATDKTDGIDSFANGDYIVFITEAVDHPVQLSVDVINKTNNSFFIRNNTAGGGDDIFDVYWLAIGERG